MSSSMVPAYDESNPFARLADSWYGTSQNAQQGGQYGQLLRDLFVVSQSKTPLEKRSYWNRDIPSELSFLPWVDDSEAVGYLRFNTGSPTKDAIASVVANTVGVDNLLRFSDAVTAERYGQALQEGAFFIGSVLGGAGSLSAGRTMLGNTFGRRALTGTGGPIATRALGPGVQGPTLALQGPTQPTMVRGFQNAPAAARGLASSVAQNFTSRWDAAKPIASSIRGTAAGVRGIARNVRRYPGRYGAVAGLAAGVLGAFRGTPAATASEIAAMESSMTAEPEADTAAPEFTLPTVDWPSVEGAANNAREGAAGIQQQYTNILRELQNMYQLTESEEEKERLRFMLADIEAQRDAGLEAIASGYAETVAAIQERGVIARTQGTERAQQYGADLEGYTDRAAQRMMLQNTEQQQEYRGLGSGSSNPTNEWIGLMSSMAPAQQAYTQRMGDITAEGIDWMADTTRGQGRAQEGDLQRLAAATRSGAIMSHQQQVAARIDREREQQRAAMIQAMQQRAAAGGASGYSINDISSLAFGEPSRGMPGLPVSGIENYTGRRLTPSEIAVADFYNQSSSEALRRILLGLDG